MIRSASFLTLVLCLGACTDMRSPEQRDSQRALMAAAVTRWERADFVLDSLSRLVNTDSLYRLRRAILLPADTSTLLREMHCEVVRLRWRYGSAPAARAVKRMEDTLWRGASIFDSARVDAYPRPPVDIAAGSCNRGEKAPREVHGVSLGYDPIRPVPASADSERPW